MYVRSGLILCAILTCLIMFPAQMSYAAAAGTTTKVAVVDVQRLMSVSKVAKNMQEQLSVERGNFQSEFKEREKKLREQEKTLGTQRKELSADKFEVKRKAFEDEVLQTRKMLDQRRRALERAASAALVKVRKEILQIVADIADHDEYDLVIGRENVILAARAMDITDQVMKQLDKKLKKVDLQVEVK